MHRRVGRLCAGAADVRCDYTSKIECTASGCAAAPVAGGYLLLPDAATLIAATQRAADAAGLPTIQVCDGKRLHRRSRVRAVPGGAFVNIAQDGGAHFVKVAMRGHPAGRPTAATSSRSRRGS